MFKNVKRLDSSEGNVWKYIFEFNNAIAETVLYKYDSFEKRTVICCSVQSGCPVGCTFCLPEETKILMDDFSYKKIVDVKIGDNIIGNILTNASNGFSDYSSLNSTSSKILNVSSREYNGKLIKLTTKSGKSIEATVGHPIAINNKKLYRNKFVNIENIHIGDNVLTCNNVQVDNKNDLFWKAGWLVGFVHGDGVYSQRKNKNCFRWSISQSNKEVINFVKNLCSEFHIQCSDIWEQKSKIEKHMLNYRFEFGDNGIKVFNSIIHKYADNNNYKKGYLAGFWDAEGYSFKNNKSVRVCNNNLIYLNEFGKYIKELGYTFKIKKYNKEGNTYVLDSTMPRIKFLQICTPIHPKKDFIQNIKVKSLVDFDEIVKIEERNFVGTVYNLTTTKNTYIAENILVHNCGTGKKFIRNLSNEEILSQILHIKSDMNINVENCSKFQIMFMSMGEPMLNFKEVERAIRSLHILYPYADLLLSTIGVDDDDVFRRIINLSKEISKVGLQFSIHKSCDAERNELIPFKNKMSLYKLRDAGLLWWKETGRKPYLNYCVDGTNNRHDDFLKLYMNFSPLVYCFTFSVVCSADETMKEAGFRNLDTIQGFQQYFIDKGYDCRIFNPAGQDDIGGGCGQLFYVQKWLKEYKNVLDKS